MNPIILVENIVKKYGDTIALNNINFSINKGEIFGLIGPDGSGKSSLIRLISSLIKQNSGKISVAGFDNISDYKSIRKIIGYLPGKFSLYHDLTVEENLNLFATIYNTEIQTNYHLIKDIYSHLEPFKNRKAGALSGGMKQKLALSCALIHKPLILLLDEPTTGIDPVSRRDLWIMLTKLKQYDITTVVSTPYMDEAEICDRVILLQNGNILATNSTDKINELYDNKLYEIKSENNYEILKYLKNKQYTRFIYPFGDSIHFVLDNKFSEDKFKHDLESLTLPGNIKYNNISPSIEDTFILLMGKRN